MTRWLILLATFAAWLACMTLIYINYGPRESHEPVTADRKTLDNLFDEAAELRTEWDLFVRPAELNNLSMPFAGVLGNAQPRLKSTTALPHEAWNGNDEHGLARVGRLDVSLRRKFTRAELKSDLTIDLPESVHVPDALRKLRMSGWSSYTMDQGLEVCSAKLSIGNMLEASAMGARDGDVMFVTKAISLDKKQVPLPPERLPVGDRSAPSVEVLPFQRNRDVQEKATWNIVLLDISSLEASAEPAKLKSIKVSCTGKTKIRYAGTTATVFEVSSEDGAARAWYSADGVVLKQTFRFLDMFEIYAVRLLPRSGKRMREQIEIIDEDR